MKNKKRYVASDGFILEEGKIYRWSGTTENLYNSYSWIYSKCKVVKVSDDSATIYDYGDNKEYEYSEGSSKSIKFEKNSISTFINMIVNAFD